MRALYGMNRGSRLVSLVLAGAALFSPMLVSPVQASQSDSIEHARLQYEEQMQRRLVEALKNISPDHQPVTSVQVDLIQDKSTQTQGAPAAGLSAAGQALQDEKLNLSKFGLDGAFTPDMSASAGFPFFSLIDQIHVAVVLDKSSNKVQVVTQLIPLIIGKAGKKPLDVQVTQAELAPVVKPEPQWDLRRWAVELKMPIGILASTLILCSFISLCIIFGFRQYAHLESRKISVLEAQNNREQAQVQKEAAEPEALHSKKEPLDPAKAADHEKKSLLGYEKFLSLLTHDPGKAAGLVRQWIQIPAQAPIEALKALPVRLDHAQMKELLSQLDETDRKLWRTILSSTEFTANEISAGTFIAAQVVEKLLDPADSAFSSVLSSLSLADCVDLTESDPDLGGALITLVPTQLVAKILGMLPKESASQITNASLRLSQGEIQKWIPKLKTAIEVLKLKPKADAHPFAEKARELLNNADLEQEKSILRALAEAGEFSTLQAATKNYLPSELIMKLPSQVIKAALDRMPVVKRAELIASTSDAQEKGTLLELAGKVGTKTRELIDFELTRIESDPLSLKRSNRSAAQLRAQLGKDLRALISTNEDLSELVSPVLDSWLSELTGGQLGGGTNAKTAA